jgi:hypothetical protein
MFWCQAPAGSSPEIRTTSLSAAAIGFIKDLMKITWDKTKEAVGEMFKMFKEGLDGVMSSLSKAVSDALKEDDVSQHAR